MCVIKKQRDQITCMWFRFRCERLSSCVICSTHADTRTLTWPNTSSLTVKVRSRMSVMSLSFIHCRDWWNSSSRYSRSDRSVGLKDTQSSHMQSTKQHRASLLTTYNRFLDDRKHKDHNVRGRKLSIPNQSSRWMHDLKKTNKQKNPRKSKQDTKCELRCYWPKFWKCTDRHCRLYDS